MNEKSRKRREWVKTAAIIFLSVMLVLTFFSQTIMNYSLPVVAAQYVSSGSITAKVRGTGTIEASDPYSVELSEKRVISSVAVKKGDKVEKDQVLFYLEDTESDDLKGAQDALDEAILGYETAILKGDISNQVVNNAQSGKTDTIAGYQAKINAAKKAEADAQAAVDSLAAQIAEIDRQIELLGYANTDTKAEEAAVKNAENQLNNAKTEQANAQAELKDWQDQLKAAQDVIFKYENGITVSGNNQDTQNQIDADYAAAQATVAALPAKIKEAQNKVNKWNGKVNEYQTAYDNATAALNAKKDSTSTKNNLSVQKVNLSTQKAAADTNLAKVQENKKNLLADIQAELSLGAQNDSIQELREKVAKLEADSVGAEVKAPVAGTITTLNYVAGEKTDASRPLAVIQPDGKGFSLSFSVSADQAKKLSPGDPADLQNAWYYNDVTATLAQIKNDPENPGKNKILVFDITGDVTGGQSLSLSVGQKSANYDMIVPNSAIREDNNGKFILTVESKSSPLGNRYIATRVDVEVLASDDTQSAISGALYGYEFVITTSTKPVEAGKQVRLADN